VNPKPSYFWPLNDTNQDARNIVNGTTITDAWNLRVTYTRTNFGTSNQRLVAFTNVTTTGKRPLLKLEPIPFGTRNFSIEFWFIWDPPQPLFRHFLVGNRGTCAGGSFISLMVNTDAAVVLEANGAGMCT
jgi:hypothetical protein